MALLVAGYWLWFRDSSFARVKEVYVTGVEGPQARAIRNALEDAGLDQSTLHVRTADLRAAVATYPIVRSVTAQGDFPHKLTIDVDLNLPVAILQTPSGRKPVAADGLMLPDVPVRGSLPVLATRAALPSERLSPGPALTLVRVVALAPEPLRPRLKSVIVKAGTGIVVQLRQGPELRFGDSSRLPAKWMAAARVLAAAGARGASYIDLRLPERPAAGGLPTTSVLPLAPAGDTGTTTAPAPTSGAVENTQPQVQTSPQPSTTP
jgi:cell division protein FtsQ